MKVSRFDSTYHLFNDDNVDKYLNKVKDDIMDPWFYEVRDELMKVDSENILSFDEETTDVSKFKSFLNSYSINKNELYRKCPYKDGPRFKYELNIDGKIYKVIECTSPYNWFYCDIYLIMEFSRITDTEIKFINPVPFYVSNKEVPLN